MKKRRSRSAPLRYWLLGQFLLPILAGIAFVLAGCPSLALLETFDDPHSTVKMLLGFWHVLLFRSPQILWVVLAFVLSAVALCFSSGRRWLILALVMEISWFIFLPWTSPGFLLVFSSCLLLNCLPIAMLKKQRQFIRMLSWIPLIGFVFPAPVGEAAGVFRKRAWPRVVLGISWGLLFGVSWFGSDSFWNMGELHGQINQWPEERQDPRIEIVERAPEGHTGEYHGIELAKDHFFVVAEDSCRFLAIPRETGPIVVKDLPARWPPMNGGVLQSTTDPKSQITWMQSREDTLSGFSLSGNRWRELFRVSLPAPFSFMYLVPAQELNKLFIVSVRGGDQTPGRLVVLQGPMMTVERNLDLISEEGTKFPCPRDVVWIPTLGKLAIAPNFGSKLYLLDPKRGNVEPWVGVEATNGKLVWSPENNRLFVAQPSTNEIAVIEPIKGIVERTIPTQFGVRVLGIDLQRNLLVTASVLSGAVLVQRLEDGEIVDKFKTVMPMVREMQLDIENGELLLATSTILYRIPYAKP